MKLKDITAEMLLAAAKDSTTLTDVARSMGLQKRYFKIRVLNVLKQRTGIDLRTIVEENADKERQNRAYKEYVCKTCGKVFTELPGAYASGDFCSKACARKYSYSHVSGTKLIPCTNCGTEVKADVRTSHILCRRCRKMVGKHTTKYRLPKSVGAQASRTTCRRCGKEIAANGRYAGRLFCSRKCSDHYKTEESFRLIDESHEFPKAFMGEASRDLIRKYLKARRGHRCEICGLTTWRGKPCPLVVDHIDGNAFNRSVDDVRLICPNCDAQLPTYKGGNIGHGRASRYKQQWFRNIDNLPVSSN